MALKHHVSLDGTVRVYDIPSGQWVHRAPCDVREYLRAGTGSLEGPVIIVGKGDERKTVCKEQVAALKEDGWVVESQANEKPEPLGAPKSEAPPDSSKRLSDVDAYDFAKHNVPELRALAGMAGVSGAEAMKRSDLLALLSESDFIPTAEQIDSLIA